MTNIASTAARTRHAHFGALVGLTATAVLSLASGCSDTEFNVLGEDPFVPQELDTSMWTDPSIDQEREPEPPPCPAPSEDDFIVTSFEEQARLTYYNAVDGYYDSEVVGLATGGSWTRMQVADFDDDSVLEVVATLRSSKQMVRLYWDCEAWDTEVLESSPTYIPEGVADLNDDGLLDIYGLATDYQSLWIGWGNGDGTFRHEQAASLGTVYSGFKIRVSRRAHDLDGDGIVDLVVVDHNSPESDHSRVSVLLGDGAGGLSEPVQLSKDFPGVVNTVEITDVDRDGIPEILGGMDDDGDSGALFAMEVTPELAAQVALFVDHVTDSPGINLPGGGRAVAVDWSGTGEESLLTSYRTNPSAGSDVMTRILRHDIVDGQHQSFTDIQEATNAHGFDIGAPVYLK